jgi:hypothetical protein
MYGYRDMSILVPCKYVLCFKRIVNHWPNIYLANCKFTLVLTAEAWKHTYIQQDSTTVYTANILTAATSAMAEYNSLWGINFLQNESWYISYAFFQDP